MITLYQFGNSVCAQKVRITLHEKGLSWNTVEVNLFKNEQFRPEYLKLNPKGVVPTLVDDDNVVIELTLICEYLDDTFPAPALVPKDPGLRARMRLWSKMVDEGLHEGVGAISFAAMFRERMRNMPPEARETRYRNVGDPKRGDLFRSAFELGTQAPVVLYAVAAYDKAFGTLETALAEGGPWIFGDHPTLADINLMPYVARLDFLGLLDLWISERPLTQAWWGRVQHWASYRAGIVEPLSQAEYDEMQLHGPKIRDEVAAVLDRVRASAAQPLPH